MHFITGSGGSMPQEAESEADSSASSTKSGTDRAPATAPLTRPFIERRHRRPLEHAWHDALESVHRLLVRYEDAQHTLIDSEQAFRSLFENAPVGLFRLSPEGRLSVVNASMAELFGYAGPSQMQSCLSNLGEHVFDNPNRWRRLLEQVERQGVCYGLEAPIRTLNKADKWALLNLRVVRDSDAQILYYEGTAEDITNRKRAEERIRLLAYYDSVTGLPNRALFEERLAESIVAARSKNHQVALLLLELGRFKMINDSLGKVFGDRLLQEIAQRIQAVLGDQISIARLGGAEFAIVLEEIKTDREVHLVAQRILAAISAEFSFLGHSLHVSCSMGISLFPEHGGDGHTLLERADTAMCSVKDQPADGIQFYTAGIDNQIRERLRLENGLRLALERQELFLEYQPQVDTRTGEISGLEALLRWQHPEMGLIPPGDFIAIAESSGLILSIGAWVLRTACWQARKWQDAGLPAVPVAVNVSAIQLRQQGFCELIRRVLKETGLESKFLELELTEGLLMSNVDVAFTLIQELRELGVKLTIDDFGTGYSSLSYLRQFKVNRLKIDRSFVREVPENADDAAITTAIINMAKALNLDVLAEGVENVDQLDFLRAQNCFEIQGYYFSKPMAVEQVAQMLRGSFSS
jgi:diguanylate cyclase (GGDEF)-like protein/PAS domain S-box-containing protein